MTAPTQQAASTFLTDLSEDPAVQDAIAALEPARVSLVASSENPERGRRDEFDTWGSEPEVFVGVPDGARRESVIEALWQLRLLGAGWPDPCAPEQTPRRARLAGWLLYGAARLWAADGGNRDDEALRADLGAFIGRLGAGGGSADAHLELFCLAGAGDDDERAQMLARVAAVAPAVAAEAETLLAQAGRLPLTPAEAVDALGWLTAA